MLSTFMLSNLPSEQNRSRFESAPYVQRFECIFFFHVVQNDNVENSKLKKRNLGHADFSGQPTEQPPIMLAKRTKKKAGRVHDPS